MESTQLCIQVVLFYLSKHASYLKHPLVPACLGKWLSTVFHSRYPRCTICPPCPAWRSSSWGETPSLTPPPTAARCSATSQTHQNRCVAMRVWGCEGVRVWCCDGCECEGVMVCGCMKIVDVMRLVKPMIKHISLLFLCLVFPPSLPPFPSPLFSLPPSLSSPSLPLFSLPPSLLPPSLLPPSLPLSSFWRWF